MNFLVDIFFWNTSNIRYHSKILLTSHEWEAEVSLGTNADLIFNLVEVRAEFFSKV